MFNGVVSGNETLFNEVALAPIDATIAVGPQGLEIRRPPLRVTGGSIRRSELPRSTTASRSSIAISRPRSNNFGDRVNCALSGGYDFEADARLPTPPRRKAARLVYGSRPEKDVRFAVEIAQREGFPLDVIDKSERPIIPPAAFVETARRNFLAADGYHYAGIFHNGAEIGESARRVRGNAIAFNGGGGEIFRNFFYLLDREYTVREILWSFYSQFDPASCTPAFDSARYYDGLEKKVMDLLGQRRTPTAAADRRMALPQLSLPGMGRESRQHRQPIRLHGMPYLERADNRACQRALPGLEKSRRLRGRADPADRSPAGGLSLDLRP